MAFDIDKHFALHGRALSIASQRLQLLADNLANADTPAYKARDIDFAAAMRDAGEDGVALRGTHPGHVSGAADADRAAAMYRVPQQPSMDGNTVDSQRESAAVAETAIRYQTTLTFLNSRIRGLRLALTGRG